ncbi:MAG: exonuclease SbcCD subunit D [Tepidisphaerales bacterium]
MRFIHTADWHLGRLLNGIRLTEDQAHVLGQLVDIARQARADALVLAGDIYDRAVPPPEAVELLNDTLNRLILDLRLPVIAIAGNHDSPQRVEFAARLLRPQGLHIFGAPGRPAGLVSVNDAHGPVDFHAVPYAEPAVVRQVYADEDVVDHQTAMDRCCREIRERQASGRRSVLVGHAFVSGGSASESERPLTVGGTGTIAAHTFAGFDYIALGHLHAPQQVEQNHVRYSGSLLKYSISEAAHQKGVLVVDMDAAGRCVVETVALRPRRDLRIVRGHMEQILSGATSDASRDDYIHAILEDEGALLDPVGRIREVYPNLIGLNYAREFAPASGVPQRMDHRGRSESDLFAEFFRQVTGSDIGQAEQAEFDVAVEEVRRGEREE